MPQRGHRENLFNPEFRVFACHTGTHKDFDTMTCMDLAGGFVKAGEDDPIQKQMEEFLKEEVKFDDMPADTRSWTQNSKVSVQGHKASKTVTRVCKLKSGEDQTI